MTNQLPAYLTDDDVRSAVNACQTPEQVYVLLCEIIAKYDHAISQGLALAGQQAARIAQLEAAQRCPKRVRVTKAGRTNLWYENRIGEIFAVREATATPGKAMRCCVYLSEGIGWINEDDYEPMEDEGEEGVQ